MGKHAQSIDQAVLRRIRSKKRGAVFTPTDFLDLGGRAAVDQALSRNARAGTIRKLARGLYDLPRIDPAIGPLSPGAEDVARALAKRDSARIQPTGAHAANLLGLTTQVPVKVVYLTDGGSRRVNLGRLQVVLRETTPRQMVTAGRISGTVIQALRWLGKRHVDDSTVAQLRRRLSPSDKRQLLADLRHAPGWVADVMRRVAQPNEER
jgi:hypothetical protein